MKRDDGSITSKSTASKSMKSGVSKRTGGKEARLREQAALAKQENLALASQKLKDAGLDFKDEELPDDEIEQQDVARTLKHSLISMIPYTNAWYEAKAAEEEMDDLKKIRIEKVKAADLLTMSKMGRHDEALEEMMDETNYDFFYFNKLRYKMEQEGKYKYEKPHVDNTFATLRRGQKRNRIRNAVNAVYDSIDEETIQELTRLTSVGQVGSKSKVSKVYDKNSSCSWRGKNKDGENLRCENKRMLKPIPPDASPRSRMKMKEAEEVLAFCSYHNAFCVSSSHEPFGSVRIRVPNVESLCAECYMVQRGKKLPALRPDTCPGVVPSRIAAMSQSAKLKADAEKEEEASLNSSINSFETVGGGKKKKSEICQWVPDPNNEELRIYECSNFRYAHPETGVKLTFCAWHQRTCLRSHPPGSNNIIRVPNQYGLCAMHYLSETGYPVPNIPIPYPGMKLRQGKDFWKRRGRHFAAPRVEPPRAIVAADYRSPAPPIGILGEIIHVYKMFMHRRQVRRLGDGMAIKIQALFRGKRVRGSHLNLKFIKMRRARLISAVKIQSAMRKFLRAKFTREMRILYNKSALKIQKVYRGHWCRVQLYIDWAARRLAKFMRTLHFFKFKDTVIMVMQLRRLYKKRMALALLIQRIWRGYSTRCYLHNKRLISIIMRSYAKIIQRSFRQYLERKRAIPWQPPGEDWVRAQCASRLARMILEMYRDTERRRVLMLMFQAAAPSVQRVVRGFLRRAGAKKMKYLRSAMRNWLNPHQAADFMRDYLESKIFYLREKRNQRTAPKIDVKSDIKIVRAFLPPEKSTFFEVDFRIFDKALEAYYESVRMPLVKSERDSLFRKFKNPMNGNVNVRALDAFVYSHKLPCRKHGRHLCGDCVFRKNCNIGSCKCQLFKSSTRDGVGICANCHHPGTLHTLCPLQMKQLLRDDASTGSNRSKRSGTKAMLKIMTATREPDMSLPMTVEGVLSEDVIIRPESPSDRREKRTQEIKATSQQLQILQQTRIATRTLGKSLALCEIDGDMVHDNTDYWDQRSTSVVKPIEDVDTIGEEIKDTAIFDPVTFDSRAPNYDIPQNVFWTLTGKNPNKRVRDYHEKFDHNMPVPIVHNNEIVYSFEGPQIYFNLVNMIIRMEKQIDYDNPDFLKLVVDHIQIFERHWRKMVVDIRKGELDRNLQISEESRAIFKSANVPRPKLAKNLDDAFRNLGFHKKVLGKDVQIRSYAELKSPKEPTMDALLQSSTLSMTPSQKKRKNSLPISRSSIRPISGSTDNFTQRGGSAADKEAVQLSGQTGCRSRSSLLRRSNSFGPYSSDSADDIKRSTSRASISRSVSSAEDSGTERAPSARLSSAASSRRSARTGDSRRSSKRELLASLSNSFRANSAASKQSDGESGSDSRPGSRGGSRSGSRGGKRRSGSKEGGERKRRGSHSDALRPATAQEIDKTHYELKVAPRDIYRHALQMDGDRYVCPFPACGKSFNSRDAAFRHLPVHEQRTRLYAPTPLPDSHMMHYWPQGVPWHGALKYSKRVIPPGSLPCPVEGCTAVFSNRARLDNHLKLVHLKMDPSNLSLSYFEPQGNTVYLPPGPVADYLRCSLRWCPLHALPVGTCTVCIEIESLPIPKPPFKMYDALQIDVKTKRSKLQRMLGSKAIYSLGKLTRENSSFILHRNDAEVGVIVMSEIKKTISKKQHAATIDNILQKRRDSESLAAAVSRMRRTSNATTHLLISDTASAGSSTIGGSSGGKSEIKEWYGRPVAMLVDRLDKCWVAVEVLLSHPDAVKRRVQLPVDFHKRFELFRPLAKYANNKPKGEDEEDADSTISGDDNSLRESMSHDSDGSGAGNPRLLLSRDASFRSTGSRASRRKKHRKNAKKMSQHEKEFERLPAGSVLKLQPSEESEAAMGKFIRWVPVSQVDRTFKLILATREEIQQAVKGNSSVTLRNTHYVAID